MPTIILVVVVALVTIAAFRGLWILGDRFVKTDRHPSAQTPE